MATKSQFNDALKRLLGEQYLSDVVAAGHSVSELCSEVSTRAFLDKLPKLPTTEVDLAIVKMVAIRLWYGDGTHGLSD